MSKVNDRVKRKDKDAEVLEAIVRAVWRVCADTPDATSLMSGALLDIAAALRHSPHNSKAAVRAFSRVADVFKEASFVFASHSLSAERKRIKK